MTDPDSMAAVVAALDPARGPFAVASHRNADGDAIGSLLGLGRALRARGADVVLAHPDSRPVPTDLAFMLDAGEQIGTGPPADIADRVLVAVDCASAQRIWDDGARWGARSVINIDHHADNTRFGDLDLVRPAASSTAEIVAQLVAAMGWSLSADVARALYVGVITDTGRYSYANATAECHRVTARLLETGIDAAGIARQLFEDQPLDRVRLLGRALAKVQMMEDGELMVCALGDGDFSGLAEVDTEGIVEVMRGVAGVRVAALARRLPDGAHRVSLRSADPELDVSILARVEGGGGHRAAAGFTTRREPDALFAWIASEVAAAPDG